jgi:hypothetical protein
MLRAIIGRLASVIAALCATSLAGAATHGHVKVLTYNVAGLPDGFMLPHQSANAARIGALLSAYDLALIQEDFVYSSELRRELKLKFASPPFLRGQRLHFGDGLSQFASLPFSPLERVPWQQCNGIVDAFFDCLTPKGFSASRQSLAPGIEVDVYNLHLDAGRSAADAAAREAQINQLIAALNARSRGRALLVAGDTNVPRAQRELLQRLERETGLTDACEALRCPEPWRIDRIFYRSSERLRWTPRRWRVDARFVDAERRPLSDHLAVAVELDWTEP